MTEASRDLIALAVKERSRTALQQGLITTMARLAAVVRLAQHGRASRARFTTSHRASSPAHFAPASRQNLRETSRGHLDENERLQCGEHRQPRGHPRPSGDAASMTLCQPAPVGRGIRATASSGPDRPFRPPSPKQNMSPARRRPWADQRKCFTG